MPNLSLLEWLMAGRQPKRRDALTIDQAASFAGVDRKTAYFCLRYGLLPAAKVGARWIVLRADLEQWLRVGGRAELEAARVLAGAERPPAASKPRRRRRDRGPSDG